MTRSPGSWFNRRIAEETKSCCRCLYDSIAPGSCPLRLINLLNMSFVIGMPDVLSANSLECLGAKAKLRRRKPIVLVALLLETPGPGSNRTRTRVALSINYQGHYDSNNIAPFLCILASH